MGKKKHFQIVKIFVPGKTDTWQIRLVTAQFNNASLVHNL